MGRLMLSILLLVRAKGIALRSFGVNRTTQVELSSRVVVFAVHAQQHMETATPFGLSDHVISLVRTQPFQAIVFIKDAHFSHLN
jgi:hypothetical protein